MLWPNKPPGLRLVIAAYGHNPPYPGKVAHQYTDGAGLRRRFAGRRAAIRPLRYELRRWAYRDGIRPGLWHNNRGFRAK